MKLLARPQPLSFESWPGYLHRLAQQNHLNGMQGLAGLLGVSTYRMLVSSPRDILRELGVQIDVSDDAVLDVPPPPPGRIFLARAGRSYRTRVCPVCLLANRNSTIPAEWDSALALTCSRHNTPLLDECPACGTALTYERNDLTKCRCGHSLWMAAHEKASVDTAPLLQALSLPSSPGLRPTFAPSTEREIFAAWLIRRLALADAGLLGICRAPRLAGEAFVTAAAARSVSPWFEDWPNGFISWLSAAQAAYKLAPTRILGLSRGTLELHLPVVASAVAEFDRRRRTGKRPALFPAAAQAERPYMGIRQLMDATGCNYEAIQNWIHLGWLGDVRLVHREGGRTLYFIDLQMAARAIEMVKRTASIAHMARDIGLEPEAIRALVKGGVLRGIKFGAADWNVRVVPSEAFQLAQSLLRVAVRGVPSSAENISLSTALRRLRRRPPELISALIESILTENLRTRKYIHAPISLEELTLREAEYRRWLHEQGTGL